MGNLLRLTPSFQHHCRISDYIFKCAHISVCQVFSVTRDLRPLESEKCPNRDFTWMQDLGRCRCFQKLLWACLVQVSSLPLKRVPQGCRWRRYLPWPLAGWGRILGAGGSSLLGTPRLPVRLAPAPYLSADAALGRWTCHHCLLWLLLRLVPLCRNENRWAVPGTPLDGSL